MDVKAILIVGAPRPSAVADSPRETVGGVPIAYLDVLGLPVLQRLAAPASALRRFRCDPDQLMLPPMLIRS